MSQIWTLIVLIGLAALCLGQETHNEELHDMDDLIPPIESEGAKDPPRILGTDKPSNGQNPLSKLYCGRYFNRSYGRINEYLVDNVSETNAPANMAKASEWLQKEQQNPTPMNYCLIKALRQFIDLSMSNEQNLCTYEQFKVIYFNDRALKGKVHKPLSKLNPETFTRVQRIVHGYANDHMTKCHDKYPELYSKIRPHLKSEILDPLESYMKPMIDRFIELEHKGIFIRTKEGFKYEMITMISHINTLKGETRSKIAYDFLKERAKDDPNLIYLKMVNDEKKGKMVVAKDKVGDIVDKYIIEPCKYYSETVGPSVFIPAAYDSMMLEYDDRYAVGDQLIDSFLQGWLRFRICDLAIRKDRSNIIAGIVKNIKKNP